MNLLNGMYEDEVKVLLALCYTYQQMPAPMFIEGPTRRPWTPTEIVQYSLRRLRDQHKMTFRELKTSDSGGFEPKGQKIDGKGNIVPHADIAPDEKVRANKLLYAAFGKTLCEWNEDVLKKFGEDKRIQKIMQTLGIPPTTDEKRVKMDVDVVQRGSDVMSLLDASPEELLAKAQEVAKEVETPTDRPLTREEYDAKCQADLAIINAKLEGLDKRSKEAKDLMEQKRIILEGISATETLSQSVPASQTPKALVPG